MPRSLVAATAALALFAVPAVSMAAEDEYTDPLKDEVTEPLAPDAQDAEPVALAPAAQNRVRNGAFRFVRRNRVRFSALLDAPQVFCVQRENVVPARLVCAFRVRLLQVLARRRGDWRFRTPTPTETRDFTDGGERIGTLRGDWFERRLRIRLRSCIGAVRVRIGGGQPLRIRPLYVECGRLRLNDVV